MSKDVKSAPTGKPLDEEGRRLEMEEITRQIIDEEAAQAEGVLDEEGDAIYREEHEAALREEAAHLRELAEEGV